MLLRYGICLLLMIGLVSLRSPAALAQAPASPANASVWIGGERSSGGRPIEVARFGKGPQYVLIMGSIAGNDPDSVALMDSICQLSRQFPPPQPITLLLLRTPNPDGFAEHVHTNAHGVELNRNFPSRNFTSAPNRLTGPYPASEAETKYLLRILREFQPVRVLHIKTGTGETPLVMLNEHWQNSSGPAVLPADVNQSPYYVGFKAGSLEEYATHEMKTSLATVTLAQNRRKLEAAEILRLAVGKLTQSPTSTGEMVKTPAAETTGSIPVENSPGKRDATSSPNGSESANLPAGTRRGEVELLPPPPVFAPTSRSSSQPQQTDQRFFELPPPPRGK